MGLIKVPAVHLVVTTTWEFGTASIHLIAPAQGQNACIISQTYWNVFLVVFPAARGYGTMHHCKQQHWKISRSGLDVNPTLCNHSHGAQATLSMTFPTNSSKPTHSAVLIISLLLQWDRIHVLWVRFEISSPCSSMSRIK